MCRDMGLDEGTHVFSFLMELEEKLEMRERYESSHDSLTGQRHWNESVTSKAVSVPARCS